MLNIETITVGAFAMNSYLVFDDESNDAIYIDPGLEADRLIGRVEQLNLNINYIINTHAHIDHVAEAGIVQKHFNVDYYLHEEDLPLFQMIPEQAQMFGLAAGPVPNITKHVTEGDEISVGDYRATILHTPGHSPGSISINWGESVIVGDCLFMDSIGRTDLYKGNYEQLLESIRNKLLTLPEATKVYSGHGPPTTIGREKQHNPFLQ
jgi:glyoxylase-like metal-dependent hydrolase (beta-lactamase superfamily II)